jgi:hypothetical protein
MIQNFLIYGVNNVLQPHSDIPFEERSRLCKCLNYGKLNFGASKDLAKNIDIYLLTTIQLVIHFLS